MFETYIHLLSVVLFDINGLTYLSSAKELERITDRIERTYMLWKICFCRGMLEGCLTNVVMGIVV